MSEPQTVPPLDCPTVNSPSPTDGVAPPCTPGTLATLQKSAWPLEALKWIFSFPAMLATFLVARIFYQARDFFVDPDVWWHVKVGQDILRTHHWPSTDSYSFTAANTPWIAYEWLGEILLGSVAKLGGITALFLLLTLTGSLVILALYYYGSLRSGNSKAGFVPALLLSSLAFLSFTLRPQMFGYLFLALTLIVLEKFRQGVTWPLWTLPALFLVWVNTHGSFIVGIGVLVVYLCAGLKSFEMGDVRAVAWSAKQRVQLELALLFSLAVLPLTPYGTQLAVYPFDMMFSQPLNVANVNEWRPMPLDVPFGKLFLALVVAVVVLQMLFRLTWRAEELVLAMGATFMAFVHARMLLVFVPFFVPVFATMLARFVPPYRRTKDRFVLNAALIGAVIAATVYYFPSRDFLQKRLNRDFPVEAVAYLDTHPVPGPMYNTYYFGGYLVGTGRKTFIDGRGDLFERSGVMGDVVAVSQIKSQPQRIFDHYRIASCLLMKDEPLAVALSASPKWKRIYSDGTAAIFVRADAVQESAVGEARLRP
jgi:hypothetical protein